MKLFANLSVRQRISLAVVAVLVLAGVYALVHYHREADFKPLFTGVAAEDAAPVVQKLKEAGIDFRLSEGGGSILVPSAKVSELRLSMAAEGLPKSGRIGFELFDKTNFGATEFTEHVNYRRALEGELERTVMTLAEVEQARVHLTFPKESVFLDAQQPAKASVLVTLRPGARLSPQNVTAINHLVASAVEGLSPDAVSVLDRNGNLLGRPKPTGGLDGPEPSEAVLDYRRKVEADLLIKINSTLEPLLGANKFRAGVSVDCDFSGGELSEELFDPSHSVMVTSQRTEESTGSAGNAGGVPGTASNLPRTGTRPGTTPKSVSHSTENVAYQTSRTVKKTRLPAGGIRKISLAVLVDQDVRWDREGNAYKRVLIPPAPERLKIIRDMVAGVIGFNAERGDQLMIDTLPFETTLQIEPPPLPGPPAANPQTAPRFGIPLIWDRRTILIASGAGGALLLLLVMAILWRRRAKKRRPPAPAAPATSAALPASPDLPEIKGVEDQIGLKLAEREALQHKLDEKALTSLRLAPVITKTAEVLAKHLRERIHNDPAISAEILRAWVREEDTD